MLFALSFCFVLFLLRVQDLSQVVSSVSKTSISKGIRSGISIVSVVSISLWLSISGSLSIVSIGVWVSVASVSIGIRSGISIVSIEGISISISISLWLSISRSLSIVGIWESSISVSGIAKTMISSISIVSKVSISISLWLSISRSLSVVGIWVSSIAVMSKTSIAI